MLRVWEGVVLRVWEGVVLRVWEGVVLRVWEGVVLGQDDEGAVLHEAEPGPYWVQREICHRTVAP